MGSYSVHEPRDRPGSSCTATAPGPQGTKGPHSSEEGVGLTRPLTRPRERPSSSETARVSGCPRKSTSRAGPRRALRTQQAPPVERRPGLTPFCLRSLQGDTPASAACHLAVRLPVALGSRHSEPQLPGYLSLGPAGQPGGAPRARLVTDLCSRVLLREGQGPALMPVPGATGHQPSDAGPLGPRQLSGPCL